MILYNSDFQIYVRISDNKVFQKKPNGDLVNVVLKKNHIDRLYFDAFGFKKSDKFDKYVLDTGVRKRFFYARVIADLFIPNPREFRFVEHVDDDLTNCAVDNLYWSKVQRSYLKKIKVNGVNSYE